MNPLIIVLIIAWVGHVLALIFLSVVVAWMKSKLETHRYLIYQLEQEDSRIRHMIWKRDKKNWGDVVREECLCDNPAHQEPSDSQQSCNPSPQEPNKVPHTYLQNPKSKQDDRSEPGGGKE